jgi:methylglutamate dehydrogenase subunit D
MLDRTSALASAHAYQGNSITVSEAPDFALSQIAGAEKDLKAACGKIPSSVGKALDHDGRTLFRISPTQIWVLGEAISGDKIYTTPLSSSRTRITLAGENGRTVLAKLAFIDFHQKAFKPSMFAQTGIHHTPVLIHCVDENTFHIYAMRSFAMSVWDAVTDAALEFGV